MRLAFWKSRTPSPSSAKSASMLFGMGNLRAMLGSSSSYTKLALEGYCANSVAYACVNKIATSVSSVDLQLYQETKDGRQKIDRHDLLTLLESPNPAQSGDEFIAQLVSSYLVGGNAYIYGNGIDPKAAKGKPPSELQVLNPAHVKVEAGRGLFPEYYEYRPDAATAIKYPVDFISGKSAVLQLKTFNPLSAWYGLSPMVAAALGIDIYTGSQRWNKKLLDNDARPSGALTAKDADGKPATLSDEQYKRLQETIDQTFSGAYNAGRPLLLEGGLEWTSLSLNAKDMDFSEGKNSAARDIGLVYGVPPQLLGIKGDQTFANYEQAKLAFWNDTVIPQLKLVLEALNRWLVPLYGDGLYLWYDENSIDALESQRKEKAERINNANYLTINEKRRAMGLGDIENGDVLFVTASSIPLDMAGAFDLAEAGSANDTSGKARDQQRITGQLSTAA